MQAETKSCQNCHKDFIIDSEDFNFYEKIKVPAPTWCPECRIIRRYNFRNESLLFRRLDSSTGKEIFSTFSPDAKVVTYDSHYWFGDAWDGTQYGKDYNLSENFFKQFSELLAVVPLPARSFLNMVNSDYCNEISYGRNSYLCFNADYLENCAYLRKVNHAKDSLDIYEGFEDELCYEDVMVDKSYRTFFSLDCESCVDVWFSKGLRGCTNCFGCVNLVNKSNCFFNEQYSHEEYLAKIEEFDSGSFGVIEAMKKKTEDFWLKFPVRYARSIRTLNSTGDRVFDSKNVKDSFSVRKGENLRYCQDIQSNTSNSYDYSVWGDGAENLYECMTSGLGAYNVKFCFNTWNEVSDMEYCGYCFNSKNCFGCVGLYKKEYCILNKQFTKENYFETVEKIKKQMDEIPYIDQKGRVYKYGEFFPSEISPFSYNESLAQIFFPSDYEKAKNAGFSWREIKRREFNKDLIASELPDDIKDVNEDILDKVIECENCKNAYKITQIEFQFYKRIVLPIPHLCQDCRFLKRFKYVNPLKLWDRKCMCKKNHPNHEGDCRVEFKTSYAPERPEIVYCEKCYQQEFN